MDSSQKDGMIPFDGKKKIAVTLYSFGFKYGVPIDVQMIWDVRFLPNPYWQKELRPLSGLDRDVSEFVVKSDAGRQFLKLMKPLVSFLIERNRELDKKQLRYAIGCTGGRHRSVAIVEELGAWLGAQGIDLTVFHRDCDRE